MKKVEYCDNVNGVIKNMQKGDEKVFLAKQETAVDAAYRRARNQTKSEGARWDIKKDFIKGVITIKRIA